MTDRPGNKIAIFSQLIVPRKNGMIRVAWRSQLKYWCDRTYFLSRGAISRRVVGRDFVYHIPWGVFDKKHTQWALAISGET
ncbi:hypothetical protein SCLCIDRAFT_1210073 [Scleroderma citrinum Foug A]|uniref:Uncharacterized protein n=1 Tax=Scleroderma citrinum Foug A TaxID=1036808 RepID=A0A0C3ASK3_9AGAM|nr:hypothetical protein SCLCIDRAFT_1210073 [Scleroderma citrinum Foug A]